MRSFLLAALLLANPAPPPANQSPCLTEATASVTAVDVPSGIGFAPAEIRERIAWSSVAEQYLVCEVKAGNITELLVTESGATVATMRDGDQVESLLDTERAAWFVAFAAGNGVIVSASSVPKVDLTAAIPSGGSDTSPLGLLVFALVVVGSIAGAIWYRRTRRAKQVAVAGVAETARVRRSDVPETRFSDVAGCKEAIEDLAEMVDVLKHPERYTALGARAPKGALLVGPPGTGKTLLARAVAGEAGVPFFSAAGSDFVEMYVGVGAKRVREVFDKAKRAGRAIVFIDELDAVGRRRNSGVSSSGDQEHENTLIALLNELDGFKASGVVVLAATNRPDVLDPALCRPGRLDRQIHVGLPDVAERAQVLAVHARNKAFADDIALDVIARRTPGFSGAQLEQVCNEAALIAARAGAATILEEHLHAAVEYVAMGRARRSATVSTEDREVTAWHEAGHTVAALKTPHADLPVAVSIIPRGQTGGATWMTGSESQIISRASLRARLVVALAGRAAEERLLDGEHTAGAANDLEQATEVARAMVERFGMTEHGLVVQPSSADTTGAVDALLRTAFDEARRVLETHAELLAAIATALLENDDLTAADLAVLEQRHAIGA